jgi:hypothetical protein
MNAKSPKKTTAKKAPSAAGAASKKPKATGRKTRASKSSPAKVGASLTLDPKPSVQEPVISHDEISLRAYFIGERRQQMGWPGDSHSDWLDAVAQLKAEALEKPLKKR